MTTYYVDVAAGNDNNAGTAEGVAFKGIQQALNRVAAGDAIYIKASGDYTAIARHAGIGAFTNGNWTAASKTVTKVSAFTNYTWRSGDKIYFCGTGVTAGWYAIASKSSDDAIVLSTSLAAGDLNGTVSDVDTATSAIGWLLTAGSAGASIKIIGYTSTITDGGVARLDCGDNDLKLGLYDGGANRGWHIIKNIKVAGAENYGFHLGASQLMAFRNCAVDNESQGGSVYAGFNANQYASFIECSVIGYARGILTTGGQTTITGCNLHGGTYGVDITDGAVLFSTFSYCGTAINMSGQAYTQVVANCTINGEDGDVGISIAGRYATVINNILYHCQTGIYCPYSYDNQQTARCNLFNKPEGGTDVNGFPLGDGTIQDADPLFVDAENKDYRLKWASPGRGAGWPAYMDIGALQRREKMRGEGIKRQ